MLIWALSVLLDLTYFNNKIPDLQPFSILILTLEPDIRMISFLSHFLDDSEGNN